MIKEENCDVLVIGGGLAGMSAALQSSTLVSDVIIASKGKVAKSGNSVLAHGGYSAPFGHSNPMDNSKIFYNDIIKAGRYLNCKDLANTLAKESSTCVEDLRSMGIKFEMDGGKYIQKQTAGHTYPRGCYPEIREGKQITEPILKQLIDRKIKLLDGFYALKLVTAKQQCLGAVIKSLKTDEIHFIHSKATILATGGGGAVYKRSTNVNEAIGDGFVLALEAGLPLRDMEFVQFYPTVMIEPIEHFLVDLAECTHEVRLLNREGARLMRKYSPEEMEFSTRDIKSRAIFLEIMKGKGVKGGVILDISGLHFDDLKKASNFLRVFKARDLDPFNEKIVVTPAAHFFMGGISIDGKCGTDINGLFACGEVAGGVHGANRLADNALSECQVFGRIAGRHAAKYAHECKLSKFDLESTGSSVLEIKQIPVYSSASKIMDEIKNVMWCQGGVVRDNEGLRKGIRRLENIVRRLGQPRMSIEEVDIQQITVRNSLITSLVILRAALSRRESRGAHYRIDYPKEDRKFLKNIMVKGTTLSDLKTYSESIK